MLQAHLFAAVAEQRNKLDPCSVAGGPLEHRAGIEPHLYSIGEIELPELDEENASRCGSWRIANDTGGARHLIADAIQYAPPEPGHRRRDPGQPRRVDGNVT